MSDFVLVEQHPHYAVCTLNQAEKRNPISSAMRDALGAALEQLKSVKEVRAVLITGAGKAFCSGLDLDALAHQTKLWESAHLADSHAIADFFNYVLRYPKPVIAAVNGPAVAGGCGLAMMCDVTVASADAFFCFSEVKIGFVPAIVSIYLERIVGLKHAREMVLTGRRIPAAEALQAGLINEVVPADRLMGRAAELAELLAKNAPQAMANTKDLLARSLSLSFDKALEGAVELNARARKSPECAEGIQAFLQKRPPNW
jgi:methylglutaconyl-CoA hydratase